jgi:tetratricopeptide (TPR) repeat protein
MNRPMLMAAICSLVWGVAFAQDGVHNTPVTQVAAAAAPSSARVFDSPGKGVPGATTRNGDVPARAKSPAQEPPVSPAQAAEERGDLDMARKNFREAIDAYQESLRLRPNNAAGWNKMGIAHHQLMELAMAKTDYQKAIKLNHKYSEAINNLGTIYYTAKNYGRAIRYYQEALALAPGSASVYSNMGTALFSRKKYAEAVTAYQKALELDPDVFDHHNSYGVLLQERTVQDRAMFDFILAHTYAANHNQEKALEFLRKAMEEGFHEPKKIYDDPAFAEVVKSAPFAELMANPPVAIPR